MRLGHLFGIVSVDRLGSAAAVLRGGGGRRRRCCFGLFLLSVFLFELIDA